MSKVIAFHIQKGGVGKSTLSGNTAYALSLTKKTLLIDADPQGNITSWFLTSAPKHELADILYGKVEVEDAIIKIKDNFSIIPTFSVNGTLKEFGETKLFQAPYSFEKLTKKLIEFDYIIFDLSPGMSQLERCIILACNEVITPLTPEYFSLDGIEIFKEELKNINENFNRKINHSKIVINLMNNSFKTHKTTVELLNKLDYNIFEIQQDRKLADCQFIHKTIFEYDSKSKTVPEIKKLAKALED